MNENQTPSDSGKRKIFLLERILEITKKMHELIHQGLSDDIFTLLEERGKLMAQVEACDQQIDLASLAVEKQERMLGLLRDINLLNEEVSALLFASIAEEQETLARMRREHSFWHSVKDGLPPSSPGIDIRG